MWLLSVFDYFLPGLKRWRQYRGGRWYLLRDNIYPPREYWSRVNAADPPTIELIETESYPVR